MIRNHEAGGRTKARNVFVEVKMSEVLGERMTLWTDHLTRDPSIEFHSSSIT